MKKQKICFLLASILFSVLMCVVVACSNPNDGQKYKISFDSNGGSFVAPITYTVGKDLKMQDDMGNVVEKYSKKNQPSFTQAEKQ